MMIQVAATLSGGSARPWRVLPASVLSPFHPQASERRRRFRRELARRWDLLHLEEERKPTGRRG